MSNLKIKNEVEQFVSRNLSKDSGILKEGVVSVEYLSESTYVGYVDDENRKQGKGVYRYSNDDLYCGQWKDDYFHGSGTYIFQNGTQFRGYFQNGQSVKGTLQENDGSIYEGGFQGGKRHGIGIMRFLKGARYEGNWKNDEPMGSGKLFKKDHVIEGIWNSLENCHNCQITGVNIQFKGNIENNKMSGRASIKYENGSKYEGILVNSVKQGEGLLIFNQKIKYTGEFKDDVPNGWGKLQTNQYTYQGMFHNSLPHGEGKYFHKNGQSYQGHWVKGEKQGRGKMIFSNGDVHEGIYRNGLRHGQGIYNWSQSMKTYIGQFAQDSCNGMGKIKDEKNEYEGLFKSNKICKTKEQNFEITAGHSQPPSVY